jgi:uncharacterized SAM-binding protein YcdF (DUF218 family)
VTVKSRWGWGLLVLAGAVVGIGLAGPRLLPMLGSWLDVGTPPQPGGYVMVLGGGEETRPFVAAALVKAGLARKVLVPEAILTADEEAGFRLPPHKVSRRVLRYRGVAEADIVILAGPVYDTHDEATALAAFLDSSPGSRVAVVTNDFHTRRARWVFRQVLGDRSSQLSFVSAPNDQFAEAEWWRYEEGVNLVVGEYLKLAYYMLRYSPCYDVVVAGLGLLFVVTCMFLRRRRKIHQNSTGPAT